MYHLAIIDGYSDRKKGVSLNKMASDQFYIETPLPYLRCSTAWMPTLRQALNDAPMSSLVRGYYDEIRHVVVLPGQILASKPSSIAAYLNSDNLSTGLDIVSSSMNVLGNVTGSAAATSAGCCVIQ